MRCVLWSWNPLARHSRTSARGGESAMFSEGGDVDDEDEDEDGDEDEDEDDAKEGGRALA